MVTLGGSEPLTMTWRLGTGHANAKDYNNSNISRFTTCSSKLERSDVVNMERVFRLAVGEELRQ